MVKNQARLEGPGSYALRRAAWQARAATAYLAGRSITQIARDNGLQTRRVAAFIDSRPDLVAERAAREAQADDDLLNEIRAWSAANPGQPLSEAPWGLTRSQVKAALGPRIHLHRTTDSHVAATAEECRAALTGFLRMGGRTRRDYDHTRHQQGWPPSSSSIHHWGTWRAALAAAGAPLTPHNYPVQFSDGDLISWLQRYLDTAPTPGLAQWLQTQPGAPAAATIHARLGSWTRIIKDQLVH